MTIDLAAIEAERERIKQDFLLESPDRPESSARGLHHFALLCSDVRRTIEFYQGVLEFPLTEIFENRDYQGSNHFFFDIGQGNLLAFFDLPGLDLGPVRRGARRPAPPGDLGDAGEVGPPTRQPRRGRGRVPRREREVDLLPRPRRARLELLADPLGEMYGTKVL